LCDRFYIELWNDCHNTIRIHADDTERQRNLAGREVNGCNSEQAKDRDSAIPSYDSCIPDIEIINEGSLEILRLKMMKHALLLQPQIDAFSSMEEPVKRLILQPK